MSRSVAVFFMRHYNEIDHMVPVVYKWLSTREVPAIVVLTGDRAALSDYRIEFLRRFDRVDILHIEDILVGDRGREADRTRSTRAPVILPPRIRSMVESIAAGSGLLERIGRRLHEPVKHQIALSTHHWFADSVETVLDTVTEHRERAIVVQDWSANRDSPYGEFMCDIMEESKRRGYVTVGLPHGDRSYMNAIYRTSTYDTLASQSGIERFEDDLHAVRYLQNEGHIEGQKVYDHFVVPNELCAERARPAIDEEKLQILGSPRFNSEWLQVLSEIVPRFDLGGRQEERYNIVMFPRDASFLVDESEIGRAARMGTQFSNVHLVIKAHTRRRLDHVIGPDSELRTAEIPNLDIVYGEVHSPSLFQWCDLVLDMGTSISYEAIQREIPVICMDYAHGNEGVVSHYMEERGLRSPDDLYRAIVNRGRDAPFTTYGKGEKEKFVNEMIEVGDGPVLEDYVTFLYETLKNDT